jgi:hypothetical protein
MDVFILGKHPAWPSFNGLWFLVLFYLSIAVHEVGHLAAGKLVGMEPGGIVVGGFIAIKSGAKWAVRFDWRRILGGGLAKPLPRKGEFSPGRYAWMVAGGPLASVLLTAVSGAAWLAGSRSEALGSLFWAGWFTVIVSAAPYSSGSTKSDGARLWLLLRHPEAARAWMALILLLAEESAGTLPRHWDPELCALGLNPAPDAPEYSYAQLLAYYRAIDLGRAEEAPPLLERALTRSAKCGKLMRQACFLEAACASALLRNNPDQARTWLAIGRKLRKPESTDSIDAGIALCEKRYEDVLRHTAATRAFLDGRKLDSGLARFIRERLDAMDRECHQDFDRTSDGITAPSTKLSTKVTSCAGDQC